MNKPDLDAVLGPADVDMMAVNRLIEDHLQSRVDTVEQLSEYIIHSGGKRLRPVVTVLAARACGIDGDRHQLLAAIIEFIHTATLLHDDVVDESVLRRGRETVNSRWGNNLSVLVGDFLYSRSFQLMVQLANMPVMELLSNATNVIAEGEVMQLLSRHDDEIDEEGYFSIIRCKTATLFEAATGGGAMLAGSDPQTQQAMATYGRELGMAYQMIDDLLDYQGNAETIGKNIGDDLADGHPTLPLIHAMRHGDAQAVALLRKAVSDGQVPDFAAVKAAIESTGAVAYTSRLAHAHAAAAQASLGALPESPYRDALAALTRFVVEREY